MHKSHHDSSLIKTTKAKSHQFSEGAYDDYDEGYFHLFSPLTTPTRVLFMSTDVGNKYCVSSRNECVLNAGA